MFTNRSETVVPTLDNVEHFIESQERLQRLLTQFEIPGEFNQKSIPNLWLRGSVARGDFPFEDIDITHYGPDSEFNIKGLPLTFPSSGGKEFTYYHIPPAHFPTHFGFDLRYVSSLNEMIPVTAVDHYIAQIINHERTKLNGPILYYHALFRVLEQESEERHVQQGFWAGYKLLKEFPGSRRTIQGIGWIIQSLYPNYRNIIIPQKLLYTLMQENFVPKEVVLASFQVAQYVMKASRGELIEKEIFFKAAYLVYNWYISKFVPRVKQEISNHIPQDYLNLINLSKDPNTPRQILRELPEKVNRDFQTYQQWLIAWVLAQNTSDPKMLYKLWKIYLKNLGHKHVLRTLLYNPSFPVERTSEAEVSFDNDLKHLRKLALKRKT